MAAVAGLAGLQSLYQQTVTPIDRHAQDLDQGTTADPRHGTDHGGTYAWVDVPYRAAGNVPPNYGLGGLEDGRMSADWVLPAGSQDPDQSPAMNSHAAPYPRMGPESSGNLQDPDAEWREQASRMLMHAVDQGSVRQNTQYPGFGVEHEQWHHEDANNPGSTLLSRNVPAQLRGGPAGRDSTQGFGIDNRYGFGAPHTHIHNAVDGVPYNRQWLNSVDRPFITPRRGVQATFDGVDSPYGAQGNTHTYMMLGPAQAAVMSNPTQYVQPAPPNVDPPRVPGAPVWAAW